MALTKIPLPAETYYHIFSDSNGALFEVETTEADYKQLGMPSPINPVHLNGSWHSSYSAKKIPVGTYADMGLNTVLVNVDGIQVSVKTNEIVNDKLTVDAITRLKGQGFLKSF